jgi:hypothetical protein
MAWEAPKIDWSVSGNPGPGDLNRIEKNIAFLLMQQPINIGSHSSGRVDRVTNTWLTLFTYNVFLLDGLSLPIKVFPETPEISYYDELTSSRAQFRTLINDIYPGYVGAEVSGNFEAKVQIYVTREDFGWASGSYDQPNPWIGIRYSY